MKSIKTHIAKTSMEISITYKNRKPRNTSKDLKYNVNTIDTDSSFIHVYIGWY